MILLKTKEEVENIRRAALLVGRTLAEVGRHVKPGVPTVFLNQIGEQFIRDNGGIPLCKGYEGFPSALCISVNDVVVHGIPSETLFLQEGDNVSVDCAKTRPDSPVPSLQGPCDRSLKSEVPCGSCLNWR